MDMVDDVAGAVLFIVLLLFILFVFSCLLVDDVEAPLVVMLDDVVDAKVLSSFRERIILWFR